ncbi:hypothetical protein H4R19_000085 [Coemansia spiralis]|nr:hypothetical protein H4R19_000085 [Coemansia spiralis]
MLPALLFQAPVTPIIDMDHNAGHHSCGPSDAGANAVSAGFHDPALMAAEPPMGFFPSSPPPSAGPTDYSFMHALSAVTSIQQNQPPPPQPGTFDQHRRSFDVAMLHLHPPSAPVSHQPSHHHHHHYHQPPQQQQQQQGHPAPPHQHAPFFAPLRHSMHDSGLGVLGLTRPTSIRPQSGHSVQSLSSNQSYVETGSDGGLVTSPAHEAAVTGGSSNSSSSSAAPSDIALLLSGSLQIQRDTSGKPTYPYATLITYAILQHPRKQMTLSEIYDWLMDHYPYFKTAGPGWKNSIRHNLSLNKMFVRIPRPINEPGKGAYWSVDLVELNEALHTRSRSSANRYSPPRKGRAGSHAAVRAMPLPPPLTIGAGLRDPMLMISVTSSVSEMGILAAAPEGPDYPSRRASLQISPIHRYQPYALPSHAGMAAIGSYQNMPQLPVMPPPPPPYGPSALSLPPFAMPVPLHSPVPSQAPPSLVGAQPCAALPLAPAPATRDRSGSLGNGLRPLTADAAGRMAALSLRGRQQVRPTPSLPDGFLAQHRDALYADEDASPKGSPTGNSQATFGSAAAGPLLPAPAGRDHTQAPAALSNGAPVNERGTGIGDLSAYLACMGAQQPPPSA